MTTKLITLVGLLLLLQGPAAAHGAPLETAAMPHALSSAQATPPVQRMAWQRVGAPLANNA